MSTKLRIFVASPGDLRMERERLTMVINELKPLADFVGVELELLDWHKAVPDMGLPQEVIFRQLKPDSWDLFIGVLWHRFGTPPGIKDMETGREYLSGTEAEFRLAYSLWKKYKRPRIFFYRCMRAIKPGELEPEQYKKVEDFFKEFAPDAEHPGLYHAFESVEEFERRVRHDLIQFLLDYGKQFDRQAPREIQMLEHLLGERVEIYFEPHWESTGRFYKRLSQALKEFSQSASEEEKRKGIVVLANYYKSAAIEATESQLLKEARQEYASMLISLASEPSMAYKRIISFQEGPSKGKIVEGRVKEWLFNHCKEMLELAKKKPGFISLKKSAIVFPNDVIVIGDSFAAIGLEFYDETGASHTDGLILFRNPPYGYVIRMLRQFFEWADAKAYPIGKVPED